MSLKDRGIELVEQNNLEFVNNMRNQAMRISRRFGQVTVDMLRIYAENSGIQPEHPNAWGAVFRCKGWKRVGYKPSKTISAHGRVIGIWKWMS